MRVEATGVRFENAAAELISGSPRTPERHAELAAWRRGEMVFVTGTAFVEFNAGNGTMRWTGTPQGPFAVPLGVDVTSALLELAEYPDDLLADLGIAGFKVSRFDFRAAPRRLELSDALRHKLTLR
jgi:hypothetical protein